MGNGATGVDLLNEAYNRVGGSSPPQRNLISGNNSSGIALRTTGSDFIQGNLIGTDRTGTKLLPNDGAGIIAGSTVFFANIGGTQPGAGNVITAVGNDAISIGFPTAAQPINPIEVLEHCRAAFLTVLQDRAAFFASNSPADYEKLIISTDSLFLCVVIAGFVGQAKGNVFLGNQALSNNALFMGIDLDGNGPTANDAGDVDGGTNDRQNFPVLSNVAVQNGSTTISGQLNSLPNATFRIEVFTDNQATVTGRGAGEDLIGVLDVVTDGGGNAPFALVVSETIPDGRFITATATLLFDADNNLQTPLDPVETSEFSPSLLVGTLTGDYNSNAIVDAADYVVWCNTRDQTVTPFTGADGSGNGVVDQADYQVWRANFGKSLSAAGMSAALPESTTDGAQDLSVTTTLSSSTLSDRTYLNRAESTDSARRAIVPILREGSPRAARRPGLTLGTAYLPAATPYDEALLAWRYEIAPLGIAVDRQRIDRSAIQSQKLDDEVPAASDSNLNGLDGAFESIGHDPQRSRERCGGAGRGPGSETPGPGLDLAGAPIETFRQGCAVEPAPVRGRLSAVDRPPVLPKDVDPPIVRRGAQRALGRGGGRGSPSRLRARRPRGRRLAFPASREPREVRLLPPGGQGLGAPPQLATTRPPRRRVAARLRRVVRRVPGAPRRRRPPLGRRPGGRRARPRWCVRAERAELGQLLVDEMGGHEGRPEHRGEEEKEGEQEDRHAGR